MNYISLFKLKNKVYFNAGDVASCLKIKLSSAQVLCTRYCKKGLFIRLKNNFYLFKQGWEALPREGFLKIANYLQVPSYISFSSALAYYGLTTQVQNNFFESASLKRTARFEAQGTVFNFYKLKQEYYFDFIKAKELFIATKEKALVDALYLAALGRYSLDVAAIDLSKFNKTRIRQIVKRYPEKARRAVSAVCKI